MQHRRPPVPVIILIVIALIAGIYYGFGVLNNEGNGSLAASGSIEATTVNVSPEMAGKVAEVLAEEGQIVQTGDPLLRLDDSLLAAQQQVAESGLAAAHQALLMAQSAYSLTQAQYDATLTAARMQQGAGRLTDWIYREPARFDEPLWYFTHDEQIAAAQSEVQSAREALQQAQDDLGLVINDLKNADFVEAETRLSEARIAYLIASTVQKHAQATGGDVSPEDIEVDLPAFVPSYQVRIQLAKTLSGESDVLDAAEAALDEAEVELDEAQQVYDDLLSTESADRVREARARVSFAQEWYEVALDTLSAMQTGADSPQVTIAAAGLEQAKSALGQAESAVRQAEASLALLETQIAKLTIYAPMDGVILTRNVEPGEFVQPGAIALTMGDLSNLTITVYIPETRYGEINLNQQATVTVDSFPGETFTAEVIHISDQAEYTPRNVQTVEGRSSTVYAIKLKVIDAEGKLKIGMPADVDFDD